MPFHTLAYALPSRETHSAGGIMTRDSKKQPKRTTPTHAGAEAAEGIKAASKQRDGKATQSTKGAGRAPAQPGSQPLEERTMEHESGYGGKGGEPRVSADQRETTDEDGSLRAETNKR